MKKVKVLVFIAFVASIVLLFASCKKAEVVTTPPIGPADVIMKMMSSEAITSGNRTIISIVIEIAASNKDAYISKTVSAFDVSAADAGIGAVVKVEGYETISVMNNVAGGFKELATVDGAIEDKNSALLIRANTKGTVILTTVITDTRGIYGKYSLAATEFKTFSNLALTEGKIQKTLTNIVSKSINL